MAQINLPTTADVIALAFPTHVDRSMNTKGKNLGGSPTYAANNAAYRGGQRSLLNVGDYVEYEELMAAGTWTFNVEYVQATSGGTVNMTIDGAQTTVVDTYGASALPIRSADLTGLVIATSGKHLIRFTVTTKNASSSANTSRLSGYTGTKVA